jgi:amino acid transporter
MAGWASAAMPKPAADTTFPDTPVTIAHSPARGCPRLASTAPSAIRPRAPMAAPRMLTTRWLARNSGVVTYLDQSAGCVRQLGWWVITLFQSVTLMAPGAAIAAAIPAGALYAGGALPLSVLVALVACLLSASCIGLLARELPSAGSLATYTARGLHPAVGFLTAWGYVLVGVLIAPISLLQLGFTTATTINSDFHGYPANLWWPWSLAGAVIILAAGFYGIRTSARLGTILGTTEIAVFLVLAVFFVVHAGHANTAEVFTTTYTPKGYHGVSGVIAGSVYSILAFGGFEGAAPLAEEARNPRRTIPRAVLLAALLIGLLYVVTTYAVDVAFGPAAFAGFGAAGAASWVGMARSLYGLFWFFVFLAIVNSTVANANAGFNVASRTGYAMGRIGAFPHAAARVLPRFRSPVVAIFTSRRRDLPDLPVPPAPATGHQVGMVHIDAPELQAEVEMTTRATSG